MPRSILGDVLQSYSFWLMDLGPLDILNFPIFTPLFGFSSISAPTISGEVTEIEEGNWHFRRKVLKNASIGNITLARGLTWYDSDFWRWIVTAITGDTTGMGLLGLQLIPGPWMEIGGPTYRRTLLLIHFAPHAILPPAAAGVVTTSAILEGTLLSGVTPSVTAGLLTFSALSIGLANLGPFEFAARIPARMFVLKGCIPVSYKSGPDFDASSTAITIAEIEMAVESFEEVTVL